MKPADRLGLVSRVVAGKYRIEELLGEGGVGIVYGATNLLLGEPIAISACLIHGWFLVGWEGGNSDTREPFMAPEGASSQLFRDLLHPEGGV